ncbi:Helix-turn-helix domain-containing protein [Polaribacter sp. KT25b]|uniref:helix-turn-helix transcriptional regulator n=1 Tax=Polaribacter sp. KT25b TaxID=1855336 RepID=UPI00087C9066|nr:helix-turn-helix domain-containing protein [Polaribacter sp. KT25b]SDR95904.1 Helix-turn-helix domain-containing protein [Polaribacter sp. KT25b]
MKKDENDYVIYDARMMENEKFLTTQEATEHFKVSRSTLYRLRKKLLIPVSKIGSRPIYPLLLLNTTFSKRAVQSIIQQKPTDK